jgi:hypothetical protein
MITKEMPARHRIHVCSKWKRTRSQGGQVMNFAQRGWNWRPIIECSWSGRSAGFLDGARIS